MNPSPSPWIRRLALGAVLLACVPAAHAQIPPSWELNWVDHPGNPVELNSTGERAYMPYVLYRAEWPEESRFRMWYDVASINGLALSVSSDGLTWSPATNVSGINLEGTSSSGRPVVLFDPAWENPYRLYYYANPENVWQVRVAESVDGLTFTNDQVALIGGRLGTFPDGHAVVMIPGRNLTPETPETEQRFLMYFRTGQGIGYATSPDGYVFTEVVDDPETFDVDEGLIRISEAGGPSFQNGHPTQVLALAQNDFRMWAFEANTSIFYLASPNGIDWELLENPIPGVGEIGPEGSWNDQRNYYASAAYLGEGRFFLARGGRSNPSGPYLTGVAFATNAWYAAHEPGRWGGYSPMTNYVAEGWEPFTTSGNDPDGDLTAVIQNPDGTVSVRDRREGGNFYLVRDTAFTVPFTYEFRARLDDATGTGGDAEHPKYTVAAFQTDPLHPGGEAWQPAFAASRFGGWNLASDPSADADNTGFQTFTVVARFDESARARLALNPADGAANVNLCVYDVYLNRDFSAPAVTFRNTGFNGWDTVDRDGRIDIGFPGPSAGQVTVDWVRWGSGVILDPTDPEAAVGPAVLQYQRQGDNLIVTWEGGGTLEGADTLAGPWSAVAPGTSPATIPLSGERRYLRVLR